MNNRKTLTTSVTQDKINTRVNRRNNTGTLTTLDTQDKINTRVNRRDNQE